MLVIEIQCSKMYDNVVFVSVLFHGRSSQQRAGGLEHGEEVPVEAEIQERGLDEGALPSLCLKQVYPKYTKQFNYLRLVERIAALFIRFLGVKGNMRLGPTAFRTFIRYKMLFRTSTKKVEFLVREFICAFV